MWTLRQAQVVIVIAGCLGMAYTQLTTCPASIEIVRDLGGTGLHVGILGALPTGMLFVQFLAAWLGNKLNYRRPWWFWFSLLQRLLCIPAAVGPWLFPEVPDVIWLWALLLSWAATQGLVHFCNPLWLSWMGDYLPHKGLSHYWGIRHYWMQATAALSLVGASLGLRYLATDIRQGFAGIVLIGCLLGVIDILMFFKVDEPKVTRLPDAGLWEVLSGPFRHPGFRSFIGFTCFWHFAAMMGAPFISLYLLDHIGMSADEVLMLWVFSWVGGAISAKWFGRLAEAHGNRVVLIVCTALKSINMIALMLVPPVPQLAFWILAPVFMVDMALNSGIAIANNGFM
ncbi:MAG: MFS transporter, partial [Planctomycetaceae bacterium]|nr:MFS transporter [Planctomycetaceae bacterium]